MKLALAFLALCYAIFFTCLIATSAELPARMASHFDAGGTANGWMNRGAYTDVMIALAVLAPAFLIGCVTLVRILMTRLTPTADRPGMPPDPRDMITMVLSYVIVYCGLLLLFLSGMHLLVVVANASPGSPRLPLDGLWTVGGLFVSATFVWSVLLCRRCVQLTQPRQAEPSLR